MPIFNYKALKNNKDIVDGQIEADDLKDARAKIRILGFIPTLVYLENGDLQQNQYEKKIVPRVKSLNLPEKIYFTSELQTLLSAGIPILEALYSIGVHTPNIKIKFIAEDLNKSIKQGYTFAKSLELLYKEVFGNVFISLVKAGEDSGEFEITLERLLLLLKKQDRLKSMLITASIYPSIVVIMMIAFLILFVTFIFPRLNFVLAYYAVDRPELVNVLFGTGEFLGNYWWLILLGIAGFIGLINYTNQTKKIKNQIDKLVLKIPALSELIKSMNLSNFMSVLSVSYEAGIPLSAGLELAANTVDNNTIKTQILQSLSLVRTGNTITNSFKWTKAIPDTFMSMIASGEVSGNLGKMFEEVASILDKKVDMALEALTRLFEPAIILILGGVVLFFALALYQMYIAGLGSLL